MAEYKFPDNPTGRTLRAQEEINALLTQYAENADYPEAGKQVLRLQRFLGYAPKMNRGRKAETPAEKPTTAKK